ncbi:MAG: 7-cyano-7-deazaguanine synthase, partial [Firmicutes bacterium]|nr:7-cyano-7-deazaguanine synthase [Bacillota bacterium]
MQLYEYFEAHPKAAIAFSGGVDSSYLLYFASACGADVCAYLCKSAFQPQFEIEDALRMAGDLGVKIRVIEVDVMKYPEITSNPP